MIRRIISSLAVLTLAAGCALASPPEAPATPAVPESFEAGDGSGREGGRERPAERQREWWRAFGDPVLNAVVDSTLAANHDLAGAVARVRQARAQAAIARAALLPAVGAQASAADSDTPANTGFGRQIQEIIGEGGIGGIAFPDRLGIRTYSLGAEFSYELDFWGRASNESKAAGMIFLASESDYRSAVIGVLSETIATYFELLALRETTELAQQTAQVLNERAELTETRYNRGLVGSFELHRIRQELRDTEAAVPQLDSRLVAAEGRLAVLLGGFRAKLDGLVPESAALTPPESGVAAGVPADLVLQRPDVLSAARRLEAARYTVGARRADLLPSISVSGTIGLQSAEVTELFDVSQWFTNLLGNLTAPLFMGGRIRNSIAFAEAGFDEAVAAYGRAVVTAVEETETALASLNNERLRHELLTARLEEADASLTLQARRYDSGVGDYTSYLDALLARLSARSALAAGRLDLALARLALHRALGGEWTASAPTDEAAGNDNNGGLGER